MAMATGSLARRDTFRNAIDELNGIVKIRGFDNIELGCVCCPMDQKATFAFIRLDELVQSMEAKWVLLDADVRREGYGH